MDSRRNSAGRSRLVIRSEAERPPPEQDLDLPVAFVSFTMRATAHKGNQGAFRTDIERLTASSRTLSMVTATNTAACLRGAIAESEHTASETLLAQHLSDRFSATDMHLDITVSLDRSPQQLQAV